MAQTVSTTYRANALKDLREPKIELNVAWGRTADNVPLPTEWDALSISETERIRSIRWTRQLDLGGALARGASPVAALTVELDNSDNRYSPFNATSPLASYLLTSATTPGGLTVEYPLLWQVPMRVRAGWENQVERIPTFTGLIDEPGETYGANGGIVTFRCLDMGGALLKRKLSTTLAVGTNARAWITTLMQAAGMSAHIGLGLNMGNGLCTIPYAWLDDEDVYSECCMVAASEGGYFYFNENGRSVFRNAAFWAQSNLDSRHTFTVARFTDLAHGYDWKSLSTGALVEYQMRQRGGEQVVWKASDGAIVVPPGTIRAPGRVEIEARLEYPCEDVMPLTLALDWFPISAGGQDMSSVVEWQMSHYAQRAKLTFLNSSHETAFILRAQLRGTVLLGGPTEQVDRRIASPLVPTNVLRISDNPYVQTKSQAELLADLACDRMQYPRLTYTISGVPAIPWLQLGDRVTIRATDPITTEREAVIAKLDYQWKPGDRFTMTVEAVDAAGLFPYANYFVLGTSAAGSATAVLFR